MIDYTLDVRIVELCREAEKKRRWNRLKRVNWAAVAALLVLVIFDGSLLASAIWAWVRFR